MKKILAQSRPRAGAATSRPRSARTGPRPSRRRAAARGEAFSAAAPHRVPAAEFKAGCLELMDRVRETGTEYIVTKHGTPVAKLVPYTASERKPLFGLMKGTVLQYDRPFDPIDGEYDIDRNER